MSWSGWLLLAQLRRLTRVIEIPLMLAKRKCRGWRPRAGFDPKRTSAASFDHFVGTGEQGRRHGRATDWSECFAMPPVSLGSHPEAALRRCVIARARNPRHEA